MGAAASTHTHPTGLIEVIEGRGDGEKVQDVLVPWILQTPRHSTSTEGAIGGDEDGTERKTFHRYYHLFKAGELRDLVHDAAREEGYTIVEEEDGTAGGSGMKSDVKWVRVRGEGWEADNWWLEGEVGIGPPPSSTTGDKR